jgi:MEDS: MEthanogen/methylotroph, DcmR Sensory domain
VSGNPPAALRNGAGWETVLRAPAQGQHVAQLYTERRFLFHAVGEFVGAGLRRGEAVLLILTPAHRHPIVRQLEGQGFTLGDLSRRRQLTILDATPTLAELLVGGLPNRERFQLVIGGAVEAARAAGYRRLRSFGEMVDVLRRTSLTATLQLEALWSELVLAHGMALLCGYSIDNFDPDTYQGILQGVSRAHSHLVPVEDYARLERAVERAYAEVFGVGRDAGFLRRSFLAHYPRPTVMPDAEAAILAAREFVPAAASTLLERIRHHYQSSAPTA